MSNDDINIPLIKAKCAVKFVEDPVLGWKIVIDKMDSVCKTSLEQVSQKLGPHGKKYLGKRIGTSNPEVKKTLRKMGLE